MKRHPIAVDIRRKAGKRLKTDVSSQVLVTSIEDQIAALERELNNTDGSESENESESEISDHSVSNIKDVGANKTNCVSSELVEVRDSSGNIVSLKSALEVERIHSLPVQYLPAPKCGIPKSGVEKAAKPPQRKKTDKAHSATSGLEKTVNEMLRHYVPASLEKRPFYCRVCRFQGRDMTELEAHKMTELHELASKKERKISFCKLCRKQFTSPDQLKEHLRGKSHIERFEKMKAMPKKSRNFERF